MNIFNQSNSKYSTSRFSVNQAVGIRPLLSTTVYSCNTNLTIAKCPITSRLCEKAAANNCHYDFGFSLKYENHNVCTRKIKPFHGHLVFGFHVLLHGLPQM